MKRWWMLVGLTALILVLSPFSGTDIGKLRPAQWVYLSREETVVRLETDTGDRGEGEGVLSALEDLRRSAPGELFLETSDYVLVSRDAIKDLPGLSKLLRSGVEVCLAEGEPDETTAAYLRAHNPGLTLRDFSSGEGKLPVLVMKEGRCELVDGQWGEE